MEQQGFLINHYNDNSDNHYNVDITENVNPNHRYNAALYMRFSKDDGQTSDSSSIATQRMLLTKYCSDNGYKIFARNPTTLTTTISRVKYGNR